MNDKNVEIESWILHHIVTVLLKPCVVTILIAQKMLVMPQIFFKNFHKNLQDQISSYASFHICIEIIRRQGPYSS